MTKPLFLPSPRPPRTSQEDAGRLAAASGDLGFTRPSNASTPAPSAATTKAQEPKRALAPDAEVAIKLMVPASTARQLRQVALDRGVTVRFVILEALAAQGFDLDMATIPEDGRRNR